MAFIKSYAYYIYSILYIYFIIYKYIYNIYIFNIYIIQRMCVYTTVLIVVYIG